jgi:ElaB/YqjD/DUF883 family membrane-anchored ribosome-binding protein
MEPTEQTPAPETPGADYSGKLGTHASSATEHDRHREAATGDKLKEQARRVAEDGKSTVADRIGGIAQATGSAAGDLAAQVPQAAEALHDLAKRLDSAASALRERSIDEWIKSADDFARRQPVIFFAGAMLTGFALTRFLKSAGANGQR